jgi:glycosyltransferase involved in cell wall biosynthesis
MTPSRRKLLLVAAFFPPAGGVGTFRALKFAKYLPRFGVDVDVLAMREEVYRQRRCQMDEELLSQVSPRTRIHRTRIAQIPGLRDVGLLWTIRLPMDLHRVLKTAKPDVLMFTGDPFFPMVLAPFVRCVYGCRYILDFRDPWSLAEHDSPRGFKLKLADAAARVGEWFALRWCDAAVVVSEPMREAFEQRYPRTHGGLVTIPNGFDPEDYQDATPDPRAANALLYAGKFKTGEMYRNPASLFLALAMLKGEGLSLPFIHVGRVEEKVVAAAATAGLPSEATKWLGPQPLRATIGLIKGSKVGVVIGGGQRSEQTTKVFDYMACGIPILAIVNPESSVAAVLKSYPLATIVSNDSAEIAGGIRRLLALNPSVESSNPDEYSRPSQAARLAALILAPSHFGGR